LKLRNAVMTYVYDDTVMPEEIDCRVRLGVGMIDVFYDVGEGNEVCYKGNETEAGRFKLEAPTVHGKGSLQRVSGHLFEGSWVEMGWEGTWSIKLASQDDQDE